MKCSIQIVAIAFLLASSCELFIADEKPNYGHCTPEIFDSVKEKERIRIMATYDMPYIEEHLLTTSEVEAQRAAVTAMNEEMIRQIEQAGYSTSGMSASPTYGPWFAIGVDINMLEFVCSNELIQRVSESRESTYY